jgi:hypothetical protein
MFVSDLVCEQYTGFTVTPLLGALISTLRGSGESEWGLLSSSAFTIPAYVLLALAVVGIALLQFAFTDALPAKAAERKPAEASTPITPTTVELHSVSAYDIRSVAGASADNVESGTVSPINGTSSTPVHSAALQQHDDSRILLASSSSSSSSGSGTGGTAGKSEDNGERPLLVALLLLNVLIKGGMSCHETLGTQVLRLTCSLVRVLYLKV